MSIISWSLFFYKLSNPLPEKYIDSESINLIVIDEADEMFSHGFKDQLYNLLSNLKKKVQMT